MFGEKLFEEGCVFCGLAKMTRNTRFSEHMNEAKKELWMAIRSIIDARIESIGGEKCKSNNHKTEKKVNID